MTVTILIKVIIQQQRQPILWPLCSRQLLLAGTPHLRIGGFCSSKVLLPACSLLMATSAFGLWSSVVTTELALTLACSLILSLSRLDYCNTVLHGAPASSIQKLQRVQNTAARLPFCKAPDDHHLSHSSSSCIGSRFDDGLHDYKLAVLTSYKIHHTSTPVYLSREPEPLHPASHRHLSSLLFCYATSLQTYYQNQLRRPCFSLLRSCCLEFTNC